MGVGALILAFIALLVVGNGVMVVLNARIGNWAGVVPGVIGVAAGVIGGAALLGDML